jgi:hypothetical protein
MGSPNWLHWYRPVPPKMVPFLAAPNTKRSNFNTEPICRGSGMPDLCQFLVAFVF